MKVSPTPIPTLLEWERPFLLGEPEGDSVGVTDGTTLEFEGDAELDIGDAELDMGGAELDMGGAELDMGDAELDMGDAELPGVRVVAGLDDMEAAEVSTDIVTDMSADDRDGPVVLD